MALGLAVILSNGGAEEPGAAAMGSTDLMSADANHIRGSESASVTLIEFGDFQCPACGAFHPVLKELLARFPDDLKLEFHHMPLVSIHPNAMAGARAAEAAGMQGKFWEMRQRSALPKPAGMVNIGQSGLGFHGLRRGAGAG